MEEETQVAPSSYKRNYTDTPHHDRKRRKSESKPPELVHYLKDSVLSCSDDDSRPPDLLPEVIITRTKYSKDKHCKEAHEGYLLDYEEEFLGFESLDIELSGKAFESLQRISTVERRSNKLEDIHEDNLDILQKLHNLSSRVETRKNISQAEIQKKWFQELQESQKKCVKRTSNCVVKLPRLLVNYSIREKIGLQVNMRQCSESRDDCKKDNEVCSTLTDSTCNVKSRTTVKDNFCELGYHKGHVGAAQEVEGANETRLCSHVYKVPNEVTTGKESVEYMDGKVILAFESRADLDEFTKRDDEYRRDMLNLFPYAYIVPTKTTDITKIKGWRTKKFVVSNEEDALSYDTEMIDELESLRNEQEALVRHLNNSTDDFETVRSVVSSLGDEMMDVDGIHCNEEDNVSLASVGDGKQHCRSTTNSIEGSPTRELKVVQKKQTSSSSEFAMTGNTSEKKILEESRNCSLQKSRNALPKPDSPYEISGPITPPKLLQSEDRVLGKAKKRERRRSARVNVDHEPGSSKTTDNNHSSEKADILASSATDTKISVLTVTGQFGGTYSACGGKVEKSETMDPRAPFISRDLDHYLLANPAPMLKFVNEMETSSVSCEIPSVSTNYRKSESMLSKPQTKAQHFGEKLKMTENSIALFAGEKPKHETYKSRVSLSNSANDTCVPCSHYRLAAKALQICKDSIADESVSKCKSAVHVKSKEFRRKQIPKNVYGVLGDRKNKFNKFSHVMKKWGSRMMMEKTSLLKKKSYTAKNHHKQSTSYLGKECGKNQAGKNNLKTSKTLASEVVKRQRFPPPVLKKVNQCQDKNKLREAVKKVKSEVVQRFAAVKECHIVMHTLIGRPMQDIEVRQLHKIRGSSWNIDRQWANFAVSVVASRPVHAEPRKVQFTVPFETMLLSRLIHQKDIEAFSANTPSAGKLNDMQEVVTSEVLCVVEELMNCVVNHEVQDLIVLPDPDFESTVSHPSRAGKTKSVTGKKKGVSIARELQRLDVDFIEMDTKNGEEEVVDTEWTCDKPYCMLGCVCASISSAGSVCELMDHCRRVECMFECNCNKIKSNRIGLNRMAESNDRPPIIPHSMVIRLQGESNRNLAKEEKHFKHTVIKAKDEMIVVNVGGSSRKKREIKLPERFKDSVLGKEFLTCDLKLVNSFPDCLTFVGRDEDVGFSPLKKQNMSTAWGKHVLRECVIPLTRLTKAFETPLYCMIHEDYGCPCYTACKTSQQTIIEGQTKQKVGRSMHSESRNVAKKSTAMSAITSNGRIRSQIGVGNLQTLLVSGKKPAVNVDSKISMKKCAVGKHKEAVFQQKDKALNVEGKTKEITDKGGAGLLKIVSVGSMRVEDFESQNIPETFVSSISKSLPMMKTHDNVEVENFQATLRNNTSVVKHSLLKNCDEPLCKVDTMDYCISNAIKEQILQTYYLLNCLSSETNISNARKELYAAPLNILQGHYSRKRIFFWLCRTNKIPVTRVIATLTHRRPNINCTVLDVLEIVHNDAVPQFVKMIANYNLEKLTKLKMVGVFVAEGSVYELIGTMTSLDNKKWFWQTHFDCTMLQCFLLKAGFDPFNNKPLTEPFHPFRWLMIAMNKSFKVAIVENVLLPYERLLELVERCKNEQLDYALHLNVKSRSGLEDKYKWRYKFGIYGNAKYFEQIFVGPFGLEEKANVILVKKFEAGTIVPLQNSERNCRWVYSSINFLKNSKEVVRSHNEPMVSSTAEQQESSNVALASLPVNQEQVKGVSLVSTVGVFEKIYTSTCPSSSGESSKQVESIQDIIEEMLNGRNVKLEDSCAVGSGTDMQRKGGATDWEDSAAGRCRSPLLLSKYMQQPEALVLVSSITSLGFINCSYYRSSIKLTHDDLGDPPPFVSVLSAGKWLNSFLKKRVRFVPNSLVLEWHIRTVSAKEILHPLNVKSILRGSYRLTVKGLKRLKKRKCAAEKAQLRLRKKTALCYHFKALAAQLNSSKQKLLRRAVLALATKEILAEAKKEEELDKVYTEVHEERQENVSKIFSLVKELSPVERREHLKELDKILQKQEPVITLDDDDDNEESGDLECESVYSDCSVSDDYLTSSDEDEDCDNQQERDNDADDDDEEEDEEVDDDDDVIMLDSIPADSKNLLSQQNVSVARNAGHSQSVVHRDRDEKSASCVAGQSGEASAEKEMVVEIISVSDKHKKLPNFPKPVNADLSLPVATTPTPGNGDLSKPQNFPARGISYKLSSIVSPNRSRINLSVDEHNIHKLEHSSRYSQVPLNLTQKMKPVKLIAFSQHSHLPASDRIITSRSILRPVDSVLGKPSIGIKVQNCVKMLPKLASPHRAGSLKLEHCVTPLSSCGEEGVVRKPLSIVAVQSKEKDDGNKKPLVIVSHSRQDNSQCDEKDNLSKNSLVMLSAAAKNSLQGQDRDDAVKKPLVMMLPVAQSCSQGKEREDGSKKPVVISPLAQDNVTEDAKKPLVTVQPSSQPKEKDDLKKPVVAVPSSPQGSPRSSPENTKMLQLLQSSTSSGLQATIEGRTVTFQPMHDVCIVVNSSGQKTLVKGQPAGMNSLLKTVATSPTKDVCSTTSPAKKGALAACAEESGGTVYVSVLASEKPGWTAPAETRPGSHQLALEEGDDPPADPISDPLALPSPPDSPILVIDE